MIINGDYNDHLDGKTWRMMENDYNGGKMMNMMDKMMGHMVINDDSW